MWEALQNQIAVGVVALVFGFAATYLSRLAGRLMKKIEIKYDLDINDCLENRFTNLVRDSVLATRQVFVSELKKTGKFNASAMETSMKKTIDSVRDKIKNTILDAVTNKQIEEKVECILGETSLIKEMSEGNKGFVNN